MGRTAIAIGLGCLVLAAGVVAGIVLYTTDVDGDPAPLTVTWVTGKDGLGCVYLPKRRIVTATVVVTGDAGDAESVEVTVTAYADEDTSRKVGSDTREISVDGTVDSEVDLRMRVRRPPHVDEDGVAACSLAADGATIG